MDLTPYLNFNETCAAAFRFCAETLNGFGIPCNNTAPAA
jgi:hypothetical protein